MAAEWKEIWTLASAVIARQPPPMQIFIWLGIAFILLMFVEGLRASFLPRRSHEIARLRDASRPHETPKALAPGSRELSAAWARRLNAVRNPKRTSDVPRRHQALRPKIRRMSSAFEMVAPEVREQSSDLNSQQAEWELPPDRYQQPDQFAPLENHP